MVLNIQGRCEQTEDIKKEQQELAELENLSHKIGKKGRKSSVLHTCGGQNK